MTAADDPEPSRDDPFAEPPQPALSGEGRDSGPTAPARPIGKLVRRAGVKRHSETSPAPGIAIVRFASEVSNRVVEADPLLAPILIGLALEELGPRARWDAASARALGQRRPVIGGRVEIDGPPSVAGEWRLDAAPLFEAGSGRFRGYRGLLRRALGPPAGEDDASDRIRQLLHELRTPVGAIQGFAELIQHQLFGPAPPRTRHLAAGIAVESAALLACLEDIEQLVRLKSGDLQERAGRCDLAALLDRLLVRRPEFAFANREAAPVAIDAEALERTLSRLLDALTAHTGVNERLSLELAADPGRTALALPLPRALAARSGDDMYKLEPPPPAGPLGVLGSGFALRLARAEVRGMGGVIARDGARLILHLPASPPLAGPHPAVDG